MPDRFLHAIHPKSLQVPVVKAANFPGSSDQEFLELLEKAQLGESDALGVLIDRYRPYLMKIAYEEGDTNLQAKEGDSDVVQDTCVKALHVFDQFKGRTSYEMRGWLRRILLTQLGVARARYQSDKRDIQAEVPLHAAGIGDSANDKLIEPCPTPSERAIDREEHALLERALAALSELDRAIIELRQKDGRAFTEIAKQLNLTEKAVHMRWARALQTLQEKVDRRYAAG